MKMVYEFDDLLSEVGEYGRFQKYIVFVFLAPCCFTLPFFIMNNIFLLGIPDHHCEVEGREQYNFSLEEWKELTIPREKAEDGTIGFSSCSMYNISNITEFMSNIGESSVENLTTSKCSKWHYDKSFYGESLVSYYGWVCDDSEQVPFAYLLTTLGNSLGLLLFSPLADVLGRRIIFFGMALVQVVFGFAMAFPPNQNAFLAFLFIKSLAFPVTFQVAFIHVLELIGPSHRTAVNGMFNLVWTCGMLGLTLLAWLCSSHWKTFNMACSALGIYFFFYWRLLGESPRWLLAKGKVDQVKKIVLGIANTNGLKPPENLENKIRLLENNNTSSSRADVVRLFTLPKQVFRLWIISMGMLATILYYGIHVNLSNMAGDIYLNNLALAGIEAPSYLIAWYLLNKIGRRWCGFSNLIISGVSYTLISAVPHDMVWPTLLLSVIAKFGISAAFMTLYTQAPEIMPTPVRTIAVGLPTFLSNLANLGVPYIIYLGRTYSFIPYLVLGGLSLLSAPLLLCLPETLNYNLPQTMDDAQELGRGQKIFSLNKVKKDSEKTENIEFKKVPVDIPYN